VLYSPPEPTAFRRTCGTPLLCPLRASIRPAKRASESRACTVAAGPRACHPFDLPLLHVMPVTERLRRRRRAAPTRVISHPSSQRPDETRPDIPQGEDGCREHRTGAEEEREVQAAHEVRAVQRPNTATPSPSLIRCWWVLCTRFGAPRAM
jgi:hypothetical protein